MYNNDVLIMAFIQKMFLKHNGFYLIFINARLFQ